MEILFSRLFWGVLIIVIGLSFVLTAILNIKLPVARIIIALLIIFVGINMLVGAFKNTRNQGYQKDNTYFFQSQDILAKENTLGKEYNAIFGRQTIDISDLELTNDRNLEVNSIFGSTTVIIPNKINIRVKASAAFGSVNMPSGNSVILGDDLYVLKGDSSNPNTLYLEGNAVFGSFQLIVNNE